MLLGFLLAVVLAAFSSGLFRRTQLAYVAALEDRAVRAETEREERARQAVLEERTRIARDMHDVIAHSLSVIVSQARGGKYAGRAKPERAVEVLSSIEETGRQALADIRGLVGLLRSDEQTDGTSWGPQPTLEQLPGLLYRVRDSGLMVDYTEEGQPFALGLAAELSVFRLVQEALTNTMKHAGSDASAQVRLAWADDELVVTVCDDGVGQRPGDGMGHGLIGMRERLAVVGGSMSAGPSPDGGFLVSARLPRRTERTDP